MASPACPAQLQAEALVALDKLDKIGADGVARGTGRARHRGPVPLTSALAFFRRIEQVEQTSSRLDVDWLAGHEWDAAESRNLRDDRSTLAQDTAAAGRDPRRPEPRARPVILHGRDHGDRGARPAGSLGGGGRYDNLIGMFLGRDVPACGFSLGLERIIVVMTERGHVPGEGRRAAPST